MPSAKYVSSGWRAPEETAAERTAPTPAGSANAPSCVHRGTPASADAGSGASDTRKCTRPGTAAVPSAATTRDRDDAVAAAVTSFASGWMATRDTTPASA